MKFLLWLLIGLSFVLLIVGGIFCFVVFIAGIYYMIFKSVLIGLAGIGLSVVLTFTVNFLRKLLDIFVMLIFNYLDKRSEI